MITELDNSNETIANQIHSVFQISYRVEAELIGVQDFPPLSRSVKNIINSKTIFLGLFEHHYLAAIIEIEIIGKHLDIHSLTVDPEFFRKGFAEKLISYSLKSFDIKSATVETAVINEPAINLYAKHGFVEVKRWTPEHGIQKLAMTADFPI